MERWNVCCPLDIIFNVRLNTTTSYILKTISWRVTKDKGNVVLIRFLSLHSYHRKDFYFIDLNPGLTTSFLGFNPHFVGKPVFFKLKIRIKNHFNFQLEENYRNTLVFNVIHASIVDLSFDNPKLFVNR